MKGLWIWPSEEMWRGCRQVRESVYGGQFSKGSDVSIYVFIFKVKWVM